MIVTKKKNTAFVERGAKKASSMLQLYLIDPFLNGVLDNKIRFGNFCIRVVSFFLCYVVFKVLYRL